MIHFKNIWSKCNTSVEILPSVSYGFGCPRIGGADFVNSLPEDCFFVRNVLDPISRLPPIDGSLGYAYAENRTLVE